MDDLIGSDTLIEIFKKDPEVGKTAMEALQNFWTSNTVTTTTRKTTPATRADLPESVLVCLQALLQIAECDLLSDDKYTEKYGKDADRDPYVIAHKAIDKFDEGD